MKGFFVKVLDWLRLKLTGEQPPPQALQEENLDPPLVRLQKRWPKLRVESGTSRNYLVFGPSGKCVATGNTTQEVRSGLQVTKWDWQADIEAIDEGLHRE